jgi:hypothetical protein
MATLPEIPLGRPGAGAGPGVPWERYFEGIRVVIERNGFGHLRTALAARLRRAIGPGEIREILIYSEKHGGDYHPAKVEVILADRVVPFAMNVALTDRGCAVLANEFRVLGELRRKFGLPYLPRTYFLDETEGPSAEKGAGGMAMYLADWLEGYFEFHLSMVPGEDTAKLILWDSARQDHVLPDRAVGWVYREVARILTAYYDPGTFAQIHPWHLAAGDFIARWEAERVEVRLVAARCYDPLIGPEDVPPEEALLFFLLNLLLRIRLDRLDGVGEMVFAPDDCLQPAWQGFWEALGEKAKQGAIDEKFIHVFKRFINDQPVGDIEERLVALLESIDRSSPDFPIIKRMLEEHIAQVARLFA